MENSRPIRGQYPGHVITADPSEAIESPNPVTHWNNDYGHGQAGVNMLQNMKIAISKQSICYVEENETENSLIVVQYVAEKSRLAANQFNLELCLANLPQKNILQLHSHFNTCNILTPGWPGR